MSQDVKQLFDTEGLDPKSADYLLYAMSKKLTPTFDYIRFKQSIQALKKLNFDKETAVKSAFATATTMGITKDSLIKSAADYKGVLKQEKVQFDNALKKQITDKIGAKRKKQEAMKAKMSEYEAKIAEMQKRISEFKAKVDLLSQDVEKTTDKLKNSKDNYEQTFNSFVSFIDDDITLIDQLL